MNTCTYDPKEMKGMPIGMFHCPECGEMVLAGVDHPDYSLLDEDIPNPGSDIAIEFGCTCPVLDNSHGTGCGVGKEGEPLFWMSENCPIHGAGK